MANKTLIIKLGAIGDVVRTTPILTVLGGVVDWVTNPESLPLITAVQPRLRHVVSPKESLIRLTGEYDVVLSLDDDPLAAEIATNIKKKKLVGAHITADGKIVYTADSAPWFDMGLISRFGKANADELKKKNNKSWQEYLFEMAGEKFKGEECLINCLNNEKEKHTSKPLKVGIERRAGSRWPMKQWNQYNRLMTQLNSEGFEVMEFIQRDNILDYVDDINSSDLVVTGDTLALHIALALRKPVVVIFICTSPTEIYGYNRTVKVVSPMLNEVFYRKDYNAKAVESVTFEVVRDAVNSQIMKIRGNN